MSGSEKMAVTSMSLQMDTGAMFAAAAKEKTASARKKAVANTKMSTSMALDKMLVEKMFFMIKDWNLREIVRTSAGDLVYESNGAVKTVKKAITRENIADLRGQIFTSLQEEIEAFEQSLIGEDQIKNSKEE